MFYKLKVCTESKICKKFWKFTTMISLQKELWNCFFKLISESFIYNQVWVLFFLFFMSLSYSEMNSDKNQPVLKTYKAKKNFEKITCIMVTLY